MAPPLPRRNGLACIGLRPWLRGCVAGASRGGASSGVIEGLAGIVFDDEDSDRSVSDIDEAVIASECSSRHVDSYLVPGIMHWYFFCHLIRHRCTVFAHKDMSLVCQRLGYPP